MPPTDPPNYARRRLLVAICSLFILTVTVGVPVAIIAPVPSANAVVLDAAASTTAAAKPVFPDFGASAIGAIGMPGVLAKSGPQRARPIASITKVVTALVVLQAKPLAAGENGPTITFTQADTAILASVVAQNGSWQDVHAGWRTGERQALETMLIPSANNYAESLAIWAYGSVPKYLTAARAFLQAHDLRDTTIVDTNGLGTGDRSTPADLVALGKLALANPVIDRIVKRQSADEPNIGTIDNTNGLLGQHGVDGIKTGTTDQAGACLLFSATTKVGDRTVRLVGVVLDASTHDVLDARVPALLASTRKGLHDVTLATAKESFATYRTKWGGIAKAVAGSDASTLVWGKAVVRRSAEVSPIEGGRKGERVGTLTYAVSGTTVEVPLVLDRDVLAAPVWWRLTHPFR